MAYWKAEVKVKFRKAPNSDPVRFEVDIPARDLYAETPESAKFRAREIVTSLLAPYVVTSAGIEWDVSVWYDHV